MGGMELNTIKELNAHFDQVQKWCDEKPGKPTVWVTMLYGSQNYGLSTAESDVDTKTMLLPSLSMVLMDTARVSTEITMPDGSLDNCKDLREMFDNYLKGNINFVETLFSNYYKCGCFAGFFEQLRSRRNLIANTQPRRLMHMAAGMAKQKYCAFDHPYKGKLEVLEKYGYDPKQLHHLMRLYYFMLEYAANQSFYHALNSASPLHNSELNKKLMLVKTEPYEVEYARQLNEEYMAKVDELVAQADQVMPEDNGYEKAKAFLNDLAVKVLTAHLKSSLGAG